MQVAYELRASFEVRTRTGSSFALHFCAPTGVSGKWSILSKNPDSNSTIYVSLYRQGRSLTLTYVNPTRVKYFPLIFPAETTRPIFLKLGESTGIYSAESTIFRRKAVRMGTYQTKKITYILARPQNEKVEKAASRRSKNIDKTTTKLNPGKSAP